MHFEQIKTEYIYYSILQTIFNESSFTFLKNLISVLILIIQGQFLSKKYSISM
jgi:hypothetical protein